MSVTTVFIHGLEGSSLGTKARFFRQRYAEMIIEDFHGTLQQRRDKLNRLLSDKSSLIIVGSSYGGLMAAIFAFENPGKVKKLILLAPALNFSEFEPYVQQRIDMPVIIFHGKSDNIVPLEPVYEIAGRAFKNLTFNTVDDNHVLSNTFKSMDWDDLLEVGPAVRAYLA